MADYLCYKMDAVSLNEHSGINELTTQFGNVSLNSKSNVSRKITNNEEPLLQRLLRNVANLPKIPKHVRESTEKDRAILQKRIDRERRKMSKLKGYVSKKQNPDPTEEIMEESESKEESEPKEELYEEVYEESFLEQQDEDSFDIDYFNDD